MFPFHGFPALKGRAKFTTPLRGDQTRHRVLEPSCDWLKFFHLLRRQLRKKRRNGTSSYCSVQLCGSLCLGGEVRTKTTHHRGTETSASTETPENSLAGRAVEFA